MRNMSYGEKKGRHCLFCKHFLLINSNATKSPWDIYGKMKCKRYGFIAENKAEKCNDYEKVLYWEDTLD